MKKSTVKGEVPAEPTAHELATLAAEMYATQFQPKCDFRVSWQEALKYALVLWLNARQLLHEWRIDPKSVFPGEPSSPPSPRPKRYPVTWEAFINLMVPKAYGRTADRAELLRSYIRFRLSHPYPPNEVWDYDSVPANLPPFDCLSPKVVPAARLKYSSQGCAKTQPAHPTDDDVNKYFALWQSTRIPDATSFHYHRTAFLDWYENFFRKGKAASLTRVRREAGMKGNTSEKRKADKPKPSTP
jgi:hypothetical protein